MAGLALFFSWIMSAVSACLVILPDRPEASAWIPVAQRIFDVLGDSDCRTAYVVTGTALIAQPDPRRRGGARRRRSSTRTAPS